MNGGRKAINPRQVQARPRCSLVSGLAGLVIVRTCGCEEVGYASRFGSDLCDDQVAFNICRVIDPLIDRQANDQRDRLFPVHPPFGRLTDSVERTGQIPELQRMLLTLRIDDRHRLPQVA